MNFHGINRGNVRSFLVEPFSVRVDPDDLESGPREMWVVLQEHRVPTEGYIIVYDPLTGKWGIAEWIEGTYLLVVAAASLAKAISEM